MAKLEDTRLPSIALALGLPIETFFDAGPQGGIGETVALLQIWAKIGDAQGRKRVLSIAQQEAERFKPVSGDGS